MSALRTSRVGARLALAATALTVTALALTGCGSSSSLEQPAATGGATGSSETITIGSQAYYSNEIIAEIYAQALEADGVKVKKQLNIGAREAYIPALENGEIDLLPEYSGNLLSYLDPKATATSEADIEEALDDALPDNLEVLDAAKAEDKDSLNVTPEFAAENNLTTIADLKNVKGLKLGANPEFKERPYGIPGLEKVYGITGITFVPISDGGGPKTLKSLLDGDIDVADIYSTTPSILANKLVTLEDPENLIAAQQVIPLINDEKATDKVEAVLDKVSAALTTEDLLDLNSKNQGDEKAAPADLAKEWLTEKGLI